MTRNQLTVASIQLAVVEGGNMANLESEGQIPFHLLSRFH